MLVIIKFMYFFKFSFQIPRADFLKFIEHFKSTVLILIGKSENKFFWIISSEIHSYFWTGLIKTSVDFAIYKFQLLVKK